MYNKKVGPFFITYETKQHDSFEDRECVNFFFLLEYCLSKKSWPISYCKLLYKFGQDFLDIQYDT